MESIYGILKFIGICLEVLLIFNLLIVVHELGHFLAAKWRGAVIEGFGVWFGKPLWKKKINGVTYSLGSIPFGGFVKLPQLMDTNLEGESEYHGKELPRLSAIDKIIVAAAGPIFSMLLAFCFAVIVWVVGRPTAEAEYTTTIGNVMPKSAAATAGLQPGDVITKVDGHEVSKFGGQSDDSVTWRIVRSEGEKIAIEYRRNGELKTVEVVPDRPKTLWYQRRGLRKIGVLPKSTPMIGDITPGSAAQKAGLVTNDLIVGVNGKVIYDEEGIVDAAQASGSDTVTLDIHRPVGDTFQELHLPYEMHGPHFASVIPDSPASAVGIQKGDRVDTVNGQRVRSAEAFQDVVQKANGQVVTLGVERPLARADLNQPLTYEKKTIAVKPQVPEEGSDKPSIGVILSQDLGFAFDMFGPRENRRMNPFEQIRVGVSQIVNTIGAVASKSDIGVQHMGGPVMMMRVYYMLFESKFGWQLALWFSVIINVNLALLNLLPIPPLDGSHITLGIVEMIRRKPVKGRLLEYIVTPFTLLVIGFMLFVTFFDVQDLFGGKKPSMRFKQPVEVPAQPGVAAAHAS